MSGIVQRSTSDGVLTPREQTQFDLSLGHRWYRPATPRIWQFATVGALVGYGTSELSIGSSVAGQPVTVFNRLTSERIAGGAFADLGAQWLVTPHLALGASWQAQATVGRQTENGRVLGTTDTDEISGSLRLSLGQVAIRGALYF